MASKEDFKEKKVLLADDSSTARQIIKRELIQMGFDDQNIRDAADGDQALKFLSKTGFDMIISDWHMPNMDGLNFFKAIRNGSILRKIPFLLVTVETEKNNVMKAMKAGIDQYIVKPINPDELQSRILQLFEGVEY